MITHAIVNRVFQYFGVPEANRDFSILAQPNLLKKEITMELDDGEKIQKSIWGLEGKVSGSTIRAIVVDTTIDIDSKEYIMVFRLDDLSTYALKYEQSADGVKGLAYCAHTAAAWVELSNVLTAKMLVGIEQLNDLIVDYKPLTNYQELYGNLISFLNYEATLQHN
jgi:hypothetical protein